VKSYPDIERRGNEANPTKLIKGELADTGDEAERCGDEDYKVFEFLSSFRLLSCARQMTMASPTKAPAATMIHSFSGNSIGQ
jgi:hypothetical protein